MKKDTLNEAMRGFTVATSDLRLQVGEMALECKRASDDCKKLLEDINNSNKVVETLITQNFVDNPAYAAVVLIPYRGKPTFVKDGKVVAKDASEVTMTWDAYEHSVRFSTENV